MSVTPETALYLKHAAAIQRAAEQMSQLLNDLLDVSRIEAGFLSLEREPHSSAELLRATAETFQPQVERRQLQFHIDDTAGATQVLCDRARVLQVFSNLVGNALKFTPGGGRIVLRSHRDGEMVWFSVIDTGRGIPPDQLPHIFKRYWQARTADRQGIGLGLAIAKGVVEAHGGSISVESSTGGTAFAFSIPIAAPGADPPGRAAGEDLERGGRRGGWPGRATAPGEQRGGLALARHRLGLIRRDGAVPPTRSNADGHGHRSRGSPLAAVAEAHRVRS
jgi:signal transduction histidine kinase